MNSLVCPECAGGKHRNCTGQTLDPDTDEFVTCRCVRCTIGGD